MPISQTILEGTQKERALPPPLFSLEKGVESNHNFNQDGIQSRSILFEKGRKTFKVLRSNKDLDILKIKNDTMLGISNNW
ncbi:hypothetical protein CIPAW_16G069000 [Carya illinoinensis]|uniref:Uncharacterized protein n=1 Tax=Carya illinoinensis TaxID=32201 RepID=A0A8T1N8H9_CARIL|nr:hypothetical protein CIPAW_16G069000 [Carya illinoinensis]KAG6625054.1 hypothetical protein CIPAW_16G069000 [Carya illinoinensis]